MKKSNMGNSGKGTPGVWHQRERQYGSKWETKKSSLLNHFSNVWQDLTFLHLAFQLSYSSLKDKLHLFQLYITHDASDELLRSE